MRTNAIGNTLNAYSNVAFQRNINGKNCNCNCVCKTCSCEPHDELQNITREIAEGYFNVTPYTAEERFDQGYKRGIELSDGSKLLKLEKNSDKTDIHLGSANDEYLVVSTKDINNKLITTSKVIKEDELLGDINLCAGIIKKLDDGRYFINPTPRESTLGDRSRVVTKEEAIDFMKSHQCTF